MRIEGRSGEEITSLDEWKVIGKPAAEHHWTPGRSAQELARDWIEGDAERRVVDLLQLRPELDGVTLELGVAEKKTRFDRISRGPRNHDLLIKGTTTSGPIVVGVEGKADETFGDELGTWRARALDSSPNGDASWRLDNLTTHFFGATLDEDGGQPRLAGLGYQLLSALAGTLAEAMEPPTPRVVLLIHEFHTSKTEAHKHEANARALDDFVLRLAGRAIPREGDKDAWITDPIAVAGDGEWMPTTTEVFVAKLVSRGR